MVDSCRWKGPTRPANSSGRKSLRRLQTAWLQPNGKSQPFGSRNGFSSFARVSQKFRCAKKRGLGGPLRWLDRVLNAKASLGATIRTPVHLNDVLRSYIHVEFEAKSRFACEGVVSELHDSSMTRDSASASERIAPSNRAISIIAAPDNG